MYADFISLTQGQGDAVEEWSSVGCSCCSPQETTRYSGPKVPSARCWQPRPHASCLPCCHLGFGGEMLKALGTLPSPQLGCAEGTKWRCPSPVELSPDLPQDNVSKREHPVHTAGFVCDPPGVLQAGKPGEPRVPGDDLGSTGPGTEHVTAARAAGDLGEVSMASLSPSRAAASLQGE